MSVRQFGLKIDSSPSVRVEIDSTWFRSVIMELETRNDNQRLWSYIKTYLRNALL